MKATTRRNYITRAGGQYGPDDVALRFALCLRIHGTAESIRRTAHELAHKVCYEHQPNMKLLSRTKDDDRVLIAALNIINRCCDLMGIAPDQRFQLNEEPTNGTGRENTGTEKRSSTKNHR